MMQRRHLAALALAPALPAVRAADERTVLRMSWWGGDGRHKATLKAVAAFEQMHPGLKVKCEYMGFNGYLERLTTQIAGGSEPDVMQINWAWLAMFSKRGNGFYDLNRQASRLDLAQFSADDLAAGQVQGKLNALPTSYSARIFLWNQTTFERAGLALPTTWDELFAAGPAMRRKLGEAYYPLDGELYDMILLSQCYVEQLYGTPFVDPTSPRVAMSPKAVLTWVQTYQRLVNEHVCTPLPLRASLGGAEKPTEQQQDWVVGHWAGNYAWDSSIPLRASTPNKQQKLALGEFPTLPGATVSGMFGRPALMFAVGRNTKHAELAAQLVNYLLTDADAANLLGKTRGVPSSARQLDVLKRANKLPPMELAAFEQIRVQREAGRVPVPAPLFEHARLNRFMREVFETIAYRKTTADEAARRLYVEGNALLNRIK